MKNLIVFSIIIFGLISCEPDDEEPTFNCDTTLFVVAASGSINGDAACFRNFNSGLGFNSGNSRLIIRLNDGLLISNNEKLSDLEATFSVPTTTFALNTKYELNSGSYGEVAATQGWIEITEDNNDPFSMPENPFLYGGSFDITFNNSVSTEEYRIIVNFRFEPR